MNIAEMITDQISKPFVVAIKTMQDLGIPKDMALKMVTHMVEFAYASSEERKEIMEKVKNGW